MTTQPVITLRNGFYRDEKIVRIEFTYTLKIIDLLRKNTTAKWSRLIGCWYISEKNFNLAVFEEILNGIATIDAFSLAPELKSNSEIVDKYPHRKIISLPKGYIELLEQKRYSKSTLSTYTAYFKDYMHHFADRDLTGIKTEEINDYILSLIQLSKISGSEQNQRINAIKFYYKRCSEKTSK